MPTPTRPELLEMFRRAATEIVEKEYPTLSEDTKLGELGIDSLGMLEIIGALERELKIQIPDESLKGLQTVRDLVNAVERRFTV